MHSVLLYTVAKKGNIFISLKLFLHANKLAFPVTNYLMYLNIIENVFSHDFYQFLKINILSQNAYFVLN